MTELALKYNLLDHTSKQEVLDFIDFLLNRKSVQNQKGITEYKKKILNVSVWSDSDIENFNSNLKQLNQWKIQEW